MSQQEIRVAGFGGQGIILAGYIIGMAASLHDKKNATLAQSYGPEARGGAASAQVIISDEEIFYPFVRRPSILVAMSQEAHGRFAKELTPGGDLLIDQDLVRTDGLREGIRLFSVPATRIAEELGRRIIANIVMLGFFTAITRAATAEGMEKAIAASVPPGTEELNLRAFRRGLEHGLALREGAGRGAAAWGGAPAS